MLNDMEIIDRYIKGDIQGITITDNYFFMPVRISGLGKTIRIDENATKNKILEYVKNLIKDNPIQYTNLENLELNKLIEFVKTISDIDISNYIEYKILNRKMQDFTSNKVLQALQGLPILKNHPKNDETPTLLGYNNLKANSIIGTIITAYVNNGAIWGLAKIFDLELIDELSKYKSTSPAVVSIEVLLNNELIEHPISFNHLAFVEQGHWDEVDNIPYDDTTINFNITQGEIMGDENKTSKISNENLQEVVKNLANDVSAIQQAEKKEANDFGKIAQDHSVITNTDSPTEKKESNTNEEQTEAIMSEKEIIDNKQSDVKTDEVTERIDTEAKEEAKEKIDTEAKEEAKEKVDTEAKVDETSENVDTEIKDDEVVENADLCDEDNKRDEIIDNFRKTIDEAHPFIKGKLNMPYMNKRYKPSVVITKILASNSKYVDSKYSDLQKNAHIELLVDAFNNLVNNVRVATDDLYKNNGGKAKNTWSLGKRQGESFDRNF